MYIKEKKPYVLRRVIIGLMVLMLLVLVYVGLSRWPTGPASGNGNAFTATTQPINSAVTIRVATFNIHSGIGQDNRLDLARTAKLLAGFDIVGLQETRGYLFSSPQTTELGNLTRLNALFSPNEWTRFHDEFGNGILTRLPVIDWDRKPLPGTQWSHYRNLLTVLLEIEGKKINVHIVHIDRTIDREKQLKEVLDYLKLQETCIFMGDFNTEIDDPLLKAFFANATEAVSSITPESKPPRVDWIFVKGLEVKNAGIRENDASDHPMVWAELELKK